jgi:hypothetical protein
LDLLDWFRQVHPWGKLFRLLDRLPWWSQYKLAIADDDELATLVRETGTPDPDTGTKQPKLSEWNPIREIVVEVRDAASRIEAAVANSARRKGSKAIRPKPAARPLTAAQRVERREDYAAHLSIVEAVLPRG